MTKSKSPSPRRFNDDLPELLPLVHDLIFKMTFARLPKSLVRLLKSVTGLTDEECEEVVVVDPHVYPEHVDGKVGILDIKLVVKPKKVVNMEMQRKKVKHYRERIVSYIAGMVREQMDSGDDYAKIRRVISITITNHPLTTGDDAYHHRYTLYDPKTQSEFTDLIEVHTLELPKLPKEDDGSDLWTWMKFLTIKTKEELAMVTEKKPELREAADRLLEVSEDEITRLRLQNIRRYEMDHRVMLMEHWEEGMEKGMEKGRAKATEEILAMLGKEQADEIRKMLDQEKRG